MAPSTTEIPMQLFREPFTTAAMAFVVLCAGGANAQTLQQDPYGTNKPLMAVLENNAYFKALPTPRHTLCGVSYDGETLAVYEHMPLGPGVVGTVVADFTQFTDGKLTGKPWTQSGTFGGMILLRGTSAPSRDLEYTGDSIFPLLDGKTFKIVLQRQNSKLEYNCEDRYAPASMKIDGIQGRLHLVRCNRTTIRNDGQRIPEAPNYALCAGSLGLCPLHWTGDDGHKALFESYTVKGEKFAPVSWACETQGPREPR
jgi:hypothetical protein